MTILIDADGCPVVDITVKIANEAGGDVPEDELKRMINRSYDLTKPKMRKRNEPNRTR